MTNLCPGNRVRYKRDKMTIARGVFSRAAAMLFVLASILWPEGAVAGELAAGRPSTAPKTIQTEGSCGGVVLHGLADGNAPLVLKARRADLATQALIKKIQGPFKVTSTLIGLANDMDSGMYRRHLVFLNRNPDWKNVLGSSRAGRVETLIGRSRIACSRESTAPFRPSATG